MPKNKDGYYRKTFVVDGVTGNGNPRRITVRGRTRKEVEEKLARVKRQHGRGLDHNEITVNEWATRWLEVYVANTSTSQQIQYKTDLNKKILPIIGHMNITTVRPSHLQEFLNSYKNGKKGTVTKIRNTLKKFFEDAEMEGIIESSPARKLELPQMTEKTRRPLTEFERNIVYTVAQSHPFGCYVMIMLFCGLRRGEAIALRIEDIDFDNSRIDINKSLRFISNKGIEKDTKSKAGVRVVPIPEKLVPFLVSQCKGKAEGDLLFTKSDGEHVTQQTVRWWWKSFIRQCHIAAGAQVYRNKVLSETSPFGSEITPHYMRHTYATDLYSAGVDDKAQKVFLGHASSDVTDIYRKMSGVAFNRALTQLDDYYAKLYTKMLPE